MQISRSFSIAVLALSFHAQAQSPPEWQPSTNNELLLSYNATSITPNELLNASIVANAPTVSYNQTLPGEYMVAMFDVSITYADLSGVIPTTNLVSGLGSNTTTYLHWLQTNVTQIPGGSLGGSAEGPAAYVSPAPPTHDPPHTYLLYLFPQPADFTFPPADAGRNLSAASTDRYNFSIQALADAAGQPVAANYYRGTVIQANSTVNATANPSPAPYMGSAASSGGITWSLYSAVALVVMAVL